MRQGSLLKQKQRVVHAQAKRKKSALYLPIIRQYSSTTWEEKACVVVSWEGKHCKKGMLQHGISPWSVWVRTFPYPATRWEVECWRDSSDAVPALLTVARALDEISMHPWITSTSVCVLCLFLDVLVSHRAIRLQTAPTSAPSLSLSELFPFCQPYLPVGYFSVLQWHRVWTSVSCPFRVTFSTPAVVSGHSAAAQVTLPLPCQFSIAAATCAGHQPRSRSQYRHRAQATFLVLVGCLSLLHIHFTSAHSLHLPSLLAVSTTCQGAFLWKHNKNTENIKKMSCLMGLKLSLGKQWKTIP